jgi:hypothetical protein
MRPINHIYPEVKKIAIKISVNDKKGRKKEDA